MREHSTDDIERFLLGKLMSGTHVYEVSTEIQEEMFQNNAHAGLYQSMLDLSEDGVSVTFITVAQRYGDKIGEQDTNSYLSACITLARKTTDMRLSDAKLLLVEAFTRRRIIEVCETTKTLTDKGEHSQKLINSLELDISELVDLQSSGKSVTMKQAATASFKSISNAYDNKAPTGIPWAFRAFEIAADGRLQFGKFNALMMDSAGGKTSVSLQIARFVAEQGIPVQFISYEQDEIECLQQMASQKLQIQTKRMLSGDVTMPEIEKIHADHNEVAKLPLEIIKAGGWSAKQIVSRFKKFRRTDGRGLVIIDHAKSIYKPGNEMFAEKISQMQITLRDGFKETGHCGLLLAQRRSDSFMRRNDPRPMKSDVYGGDNMHEALDVFLGMWRPEQVYERMLPTADEFSRNGGMSQKDRYADKIEQNRGKAFIHSLKNRGGDETAKAELAWEPKYTRFSDPIVETPMVGDEQMDMMAGF